MNNCQICGSELRIVPAGVSRKTGKPYNQFQACPNNCQQPKTATVTQRVQPVKQPDWDNIALGKVTHGVVTSMIQAGWDFDRAAAEVDGWVELIMKGQKPF